MSVVLTIPSLGLTTVRDGAGIITVSGTLHNGGLSDALVAEISTDASAKLDAVNTTAAVPISLGDLLAGGDVAFSVTFPRTIIGGTRVIQVSVNFTGGSSTAARTVTVPPLQNASLGLGIIGMSG